MVSRLARGRIYYGWIIVLVAFLTMLAIAGVRSVPGVLILPLEAEFGWTRAEISLAVSINLFLFGLCGPFAAALMQRVGMRAMMVGALLLLSGALLLATWVEQLWQLTLLWGVLVGLGTGAMAGWVAAAVANRWFVARRGLVVGLLTASNATGQLAFLPLLAAVVAGPGWRAAVLLAAAVALLAALMVRRIGTADQSPILSERPAGV